MAREGRELERLVTILEDALGGEGVHVTSPDRLRDRITGRLREVDVAMRAGGQDGPVIAVCEVRDRTGAQDVTWVEQVVTKGKDIGVPQVILVSSDGFSQDAVKKARAYGVGVHLITDVTPGAVKQWFNLLVMLDEQVRMLVECHVDLGDVSANVSDFSDEVKRIRHEHGLAGRIFDRRELPSISPEELFDYWWLKHHEEVERTSPKTGHLCERRP